MRRKAREERVVIVNSGFVGSLSTLGSVEVFEAAGGKYFGGYEGFVESSRTRIPMD